MRTLSAVLIAALLTFSSLGYAQEAGPKLEPAPPSSQTPRWGLGASYSLTFLSFPLPFKHGPTLLWVRSPKWSYEISSFNGSIGAGASYFITVAQGTFRESLTSASARYFPWEGNFHLLFGLTRQNYELKLEGSLLDRATPGITQNDLLATSTLGLQLGVGHRWWRESMVLQVDWLVLNFPFSTLRSDGQALNYLTNPDDRGKVETALRVMRHLPSATLMKLSLGYVF